jgi:hypothetical protein
MITQRLEPTLRPNARPPVPGQRRAVSLLFLPSLPLLLLLLSLLMLMMS